MLENEMMRKKLIRIIEDNGIKVKYVSENLGWNYINLSKFKNGKFNYKEKKLIILDNFLKKYDK